MSTNKCVYCNNEITNAKFCNNSCAAKYNNSIRSVESRKKQQVSVKKTYANKKTIKNQFGEYKIKDKFEFVDPYTKVYLCVCKYSGKKFYSKTVKQIYPDLKRNKKEYSWSCQFRFGISKYPEWFSYASTLIEQYGWYSTPGSNKNGKMNVNGISRDHLYSVTDGWKNQISPEIIRHPANCQLVPHKLNQSKYKKSSITIDELYARIQKFESMYGTI